MHCKKNRRNSMSSIIRKRKHDFEQWMAKVEDKVQATIINYAGAIDHISRHYSERTGKSIDIYQIDDRLRLKGICAEYDKGGMYEDFAENDHGAKRAAISAYMRYFEASYRGDNSGFSEETHFSVSGSRIVVKKNAAGKRTITINLQMEEIKE
jgi:hypothetical protein